MAPTLPNLCGQEDVYSVHTTEHAPEAFLARVDIVVLLEPFPGALARVFALLCLFELVPQFAQVTRWNEGDIRLELGFDQLQPERLNLLLRKIQQLTECLEVYKADAGAMRSQQGYAGEIRKAS
jgi:ribosomal protein S15P/S13E